MPERVGSPWTRPLLPLLAFATVLLPGTALAQERNLSEKFRSGSRVVIPQGETVPDDLYATGGRVSIDGRVDGDVVAAGGELGVRGSIRDDLIVASGRVTVAGHVGGDIRAVGGEVTVEGSVSEDALLAGGRVAITRGATVGGDLVFSGGDVSLDGTVKGNVLGNARSYEKSGSVGGSEKVSVGRPERAPPTPSDRVLGVVRRYVAILVVGALFLWLAPGLAERTADQVRARPLPSLGVGVLGVIGFALALLIIVLAAVLLSIVLGLIGLGGLVAALAFAAILAAAAVTFAFVVMVAFLSYALVGMASGRVLVRSAAGSGRMVGMGILAVGAAVVVILGSLPVIGGFVRVLVVLLALGALLLAIRPRPRAPEPAD